MVDNSILEPLKLYNSSLKAKFVEEANNFFDELINEAKTDVPLNKATVAKYNKARAVADEAKNKMNATKGWRVAAIVFAIIFLIVGVAFILFSFMENANLALDIPVGIVGLLLGIGLILLITLHLNKVVKAREEKFNRLDAKAKEILRECYDQTSSLCSLFDWNMANKIIRKVTPLIQVDDYFDMKRFDMLSQKYGLSDIMDEDTSTEMVISGEVVGNPFAMVRNLHHYDSVKTYTGFLTITWTERTTDSEGHTSYVQRSETLTASVTRPYPAYEHITYLIYGNDAAPNLSFSRKPCGLMHPSEKDVDKFVRKGEKKLEDYAEDCVKNNKLFTPMANTKFETLWGGWDRDHEVEYRLLFTALAQENLCSLVTDPKHFGDDFDFKKVKTLNFVCSTHSQTCDYEINPASFRHYDVETIRNSFLSKTEDYFENLFFDLAPVLSIPLYQQQKPVEFIYKKTFHTNFNSYELEAMANSLPEKYFAHPTSATRAILKKTYAEVSGKTDKALITAHSYYTVQRLTYVPVHGGDGKMHDVPVYWDEYIPITNKRYMAVKECNTTRKGYNDSLNGLREFFGDRVDSDEIVFKRGVLGFLIDEAYNEEDDKEIDKVFTRFNKQN